MENKSLNEQKHETAPVFARIGDKNLLSRHLGHSTFTHTLNSAKAASSGSLFMFASFLPATTLQKHTRGRLLLLIINIAQSSSAC